MLEEVIKVVAENDVNCDISINSLGNGKAVLRLSPIVGEIKESASDYEKKLKAALAMPLKVKGTPEEIKESLVEHVKTFVESRSGWMDKLKELDKEIAKAKPKPKQEGEVTAPKRKAGRPKGSTNKTAKTEA